MLLLTFAVHLSEIRRELLPRPFKIPELNPELALPFGFA